MKNLLNLNTLKTALGIALGFALFDYIDTGNVDWIKSIITALIAIVLMTIFGAFKK